MITFRHIAAFILITMLCFTCIFAQSVVEQTQSGDYEGKIIILHSNDVHGALAGYAKMAFLRDRYLDQGADVLLVDGGDFIQGTPYVAQSKGLSAIEMMNMTGYDIVAIGNHEFDYGLEQLQENLAQAQFTYLCANAFDEEGNPLFPAYALCTTPGGAKIGFFAIVTPQTKTKTMPSLVKNIEFAQYDELYALAQNAAAALRGQLGADTVICIAHLGIDSEAKGNRSVDLLENTTGIDFLIDGHSHSVYSEYEGLPMQQTGTKFQYIGVIVIDSASGEIEDEFLVDCSTVGDDPQILAASKKITDEIDAIYSQVFAKAEVDLNGDKAPGNRTMETNSGDLIADSMVSAIDFSALDVPAEDVVCVLNGGGIRAWIKAGDITRADINEVLPFGNTIYVNQVTGKQLLEALEASTFAAPEPTGGFPQIAGMEITIDTTKPYAQAAKPYPGSSYFGPAEIRRVTINSVNGKPFDPDKTYAVVTNNFCATGGDTYYALKNAISQFDTGMADDKVLMDYIENNLGGVIGQQYAQPQGIITIIQ
ncbi:MAG: bifunctional metallophosphatase/5'-nucleotidase [Spirochaetales bacterium]|nr:bifunctional metallophosphatase/5'-nucleotidase [Spirochaetales bacterium]